MGTTLKILIRILINCTLIIHWSKPIQAFIQGYMETSRLVTVTVAIVLFVSVFVVLYFSGDSTETTPSVSPLSAFEPDVNNPVAAVDVQTKPLPELPVKELQVETSARVSSHTIAVVAIIFLTISVLSLAVIIYIYRARSQQQEIEDKIEELERKQIERDAHLEQASQLDNERRGKTFTRRIIVLVCTSLLGCGIGYVVRYNMKATKKASGGLIAGGVLATCVIFINIICWYERVSFL
jgi:hypothetical protein